MPVVGARLLHTPGETESFTVQEGGDSRSGRRDRWDLLLTDANGDGHWGIDDWPSLPRGGISRYVVAGPGYIGGRGKVASTGEVAPFTLRLSSYLKPYEVGTYEIRAAYCNDQTIADRDGHSGLTVFVSEPLEFEWLPRTIARSEESDAKIDALVDELIALDHVIATSFHLDSYSGQEGTDAHVLDRLFACGYAALPRLIERAKASTFTADRSRLIAAMFSLTGIGPMPSRPTPHLFRLGRLLGPHCVIRSRPSNESGIAGVTLPMESEGPEATIEEQLRAIRRLESYMRYFRIEDH